MRVNLPNIHRFKYLLENKHYKFRNDIFFVRGIKNSALYDLHTYKVYSINETAKQIIFKRDKNDKYLRELVKLKLLVLPNYVHTKVKFNKPKHKLRFVWLEITQNCQNMCIHCYGDFGNKKLKPKILTTPHINWKKVIREISNIGVEAIQFIGGEPLLYRGNNGETLVDLIRFAKNQGIKDIEIFSNGLAFTNKNVEEFKKLKVSVAISLYSNEPKVHDQITQIKGSHVLTMKAIMLCKKYKIPLRIGFIAMKQNEKTIEQTSNFIQNNKLGKRSKPDIIRPTVNGLLTQLMPSVDCQIKYSFATKPSFITSLKTFSTNINYNPCLERTLAITSNGDVLPCVFSRNMILGNINKQKLKDIIHGSLTQKAWHTTKDNIQVCKDCEYRYACNDCRPLSQGMNGGNYYSAPPARCTYNPYDGKWGEGVWRVKNNNTMYTKFKDL
jgi:radical SAM protein with 4Fe4S-binding SPASM domain